jgi:histidine ammonia-lyase
MSLQAVTRLERVVAVEALCACQALDLDWSPPGEAVAALHAAVRERVTMLTDDRPPADDIVAVEALVRDGVLVRDVAVA